jgi:hypothetical protein
MKGVVKKAIPYKYKYFSEITETLTQLFRRAGSAPLWGRSLFSYIAGL